VTGHVLRERILSRLIIDPSGCLLWTGAKNDQGYGQINSRATGTIYVHRLMYEWFVRPIPAGLHIDHLCRMRSCGAPAHLEAVTCRENILRGESPSAVASRQTHCINGHEFSPENTYLRTDGQGRQCRECKRLRMARCASAAREVFVCPDCGGDLDEDAFAMFCPYCETAIPDALLRDDADSGRDEES
jgi:hypothetical protein